MKNPFEELQENKELLARIHILLMKIEEQYFAMKEKPPTSISREEFGIKQEILEVCEIISEKLDAKESA